MPQDLWKEIEGFPRYQISYVGDVVDTQNNRHLTRSYVQKGIPTVGLVRDREVYRRSLPLLVAKHWLSDSQDDIFDTPIQLDGDRSNCHVNNLMWRPRWFAVLYHIEKTKPQTMMDVPILLVEEDEVYDSVRDVSIAYGILESSIIASLDSGCKTQPQGYTFQLY